MRFVRCFSMPKRTSGRWRTLYKAGAISETQFDGARTQFEVAQANYESVSRLVDVRTPIAGTVTSSVGPPGRLRHCRPATRGSRDSGQTSGEVRCQHGQYQVCAPGGGCSNCVGRCRGHCSPAGSPQSPNRPTPSTRSFQVEAMLDNDVNPRFVRGCLSIYR